MDNSKEIEKTAEPEVPEVTSEVQENTVQVSGSSPAELIRLAITTGGVDLEKMEKLMVLQERWEATEAKKEYQRAMTQFKANPPKIEKDSQVAFKDVKYKYANLANVCEKIGAELSKYGLSASWTTQQNGSVSVTCRITHVKGHSEETTLSAPADTTGSKNAIQAIGSTVSYLERYTLLALTGLATYEQDTDERPAEGPVEYITDEQKGMILDMITATESDLPKFLKYLKVESLETMPASVYNKAIMALDTKAKVKK